MISYVTCREPSTQAIKQNVEHFLFGYSATSQEVMRICNHVIGDIDGNNVKVRRWLTSESEV